jgi:hypothetical protein
MTMSAGFIPVVIRVLRVLELLIISQVSCYLFNVCLLIFLFFDRTQFFHLLVESSSISSPTRRQTYLDQNRLFLNFVALVSVVVVLIIF